MFSGHHNIHIHMKKCYHIERFPTRIHLITLNDFLCEQFEKGELNKCCPILVEGIIKVSTFHKFKSNQSNVFQCQLDNLLLKNSHVNFSRNIPFKKLLTSWNLSACSICERTAFFEVSWSHEQVHEQWAWASESVFHILYLHLPPKDELIKDEICLLKVEDNVQLTHRSEVFVQYFDIPIESSWSTWKNNTPLSSTDGACHQGSTISGKRTCE